MQTFLISSSFWQTAECLDKKRLGKQRVEGLQILKAIRDPNYGWQNHPAVNMWRECPVALFEYTYIICEYWREVRGYKDSIQNTLIKEFPLLHQEMYHKPTQRPTWFLNKEILDKVTSSHRAALLAKNHKHYNQFKWSDLPKIDYFWPVGMILASPSKEPS